MSASLNTCSRIRSISSARSRMSSSGTPDWYTLSSSLQTPRNAANYHHEKHSSGQLIVLPCKERLHLQLVPNAVPVQVVHHEEGLRVKVLAIHVVLLLPHLLQLCLVSGRVQWRVLVVLLLLRLQLRLVLLLVVLVHALELLVLLKLLLHLVPLELVPAQFVRLRELVAGLVDQLAEVLLLERVRVRVVQVLCDLHVAPVDVVGHLKLLDGQLPETLQLLAFKFVQAGAHVVRDVVQLLGDLAGLEGGERE